MEARSSFWMIDWNSRASRSAPPPAPAMMTISTGFCGSHVLRRNRQGHARHGSRRDEFHDRTSRESVKQV